MTASQPSSCNSSTLSGDDTTPTGVPPPLSTYCTAYPPSPPDAPQTSTVSPCFMSTPLCDTSMRYEVELHSALHAASSQERCAGFGIDWLALTTVRSARPPKFDSNPQMRWLVASMESS